MDVHYNQIKLERTNSSLFFAELIMTIRHCKLRRQRLIKKHIKQWEFSTCYSTVCFSTSQQCKFLSMCLSNVLYKSALLVSISLISIILHNSYIHVHVHVFLCMFCMFPINFSERRCYRFMITVVFGWLNY